MSDIASAMKAGAEAAKEAGTDQAKERMRPTTMRWTHIALPSTNLDKSIEWYETFTPLRLLDRRSDADGESAWIGQSDNGDKPFILVLVSFTRDQHKGRQPIMAPFAHIGMEMPTLADVDNIAEMGRAAGCLVWDPQWMPEPVGYICALTDPDGNMIEFSFDQGVYEKAKEVWGS